MMGVQSNVNEAIDLDVDDSAAEIELMNELRDDGLGAIQKNLLGLTDQ